MSEQEIESLSDRDLSALVAERVMGWPVFRPPINTEPKPYPCVYLLDSGSVFLDRAVGQREGWYPCSDIASAFLIVEQMRDRGYRFTFTFDPEQEARCDFGRFGDPVSSLGHAQHGSPARAICHAALKAVESK